MQIIPLFDDYPNAALEFGIVRNTHGSPTGYVIDIAEGDSKMRADQLTKELINAGVVSPGRATGRVVRIRNGTTTELDSHLLEEFEGSSEQLQDVVIVADRASVDLLPLVSKCGSRTAFVFHHASLLAHLCVILRERGIPAVAIQDDATFDELVPDSRISVEASNADPTLLRVIQEPPR
jgi:hypothetical protein